MQVRKYLQIGKPNNLKKKEKPFSLTLTSRKINVSKKKSKSRSRSSKQNSKNRCSNSKSKGKPGISPLGLKKSHILNTTPNQEKKGKKKKQKNMNSSRNQFSHRELEKNSHSISTKLMTDRSPVRNKEKDKDRSPRPSKLSKKTRKSQKQKNKTKLTKIKTEIHQEQSEQCEGETARKLKKNIPSIKTKFSFRKQSYFDPEILEKLNLNEKAPMGMRNKFKSVNEGQVESKTFRFTTESVQDYGTGTDDLEANEIGFKDIQFLKKEQEMKWRIMYLELNDLKNNGTPQKLNDIIEESEKNLSEFQTKSKKICSSEIKNSYLIESPVVIQKALRRERKSVEETQQLLKNISEKRLLQELEMIDDHDNEFIHKQVSKFSSNSFCLEFEKELEEFSKKNEVETVEIAPIPELEFEKANQICEFMEISLLLQFCQEMVWNEKILHSYLIGLKQKEKLPLVNSDNDYAIKLAQGLFEYIAEEDMIVEFLARLNVPFGNSPEINLKWVRNYFLDNSQEMVQLEQAVEPIIDTYALGGYDSQFYIIPSQGQYFFNHCVYGCLGEILDFHRPGGLTGLPPLQRSPSNLISDYGKIAKQVMSDFLDMIAVRMGRMEFQMDEEAQEVIEKTYMRMDKHLVYEQEYKWRKNQDNIFENKFFIAAAVVDSIFNEQVLMLYNEFV